MKSEQEDSVDLKPGSDQPVRLRFRFLSAQIGEIETKEQAVSSPVCGWLVPNLLDNSLLVYSAKGEALGHLDTTNTWRPCPGPENSVFAHGVDLPISLFRNPYLYKVVQWLHDKNPEVLNLFISTLDATCLNITPESYVPNTSLSLLIGNPIAIVRASLVLLLVKPSASDQARAVHRQAPAFEEVEFAIRLGGDKQLNDGLVGYWEEFETETLGNQFYSSHGFQPQVSDVDIVTSSSNIPPIRQSLISPRRNVTLLMNPHGIVHATTGILPTESIKIPAENFVDELRTIELSFHTAPLLVTTNQQGQPLSISPDGTWQWQEKLTDQWVQTAQQDTHTVKTPIPLSSSDTELKDGWLSLKSKLEDEVKK